MDVHICEVFFSGDTLENEMLQRCLAGIVLMFAFVPAWCRDVLPIEVGRDHERVMYQVGAERGNVEQLVAYLRKVVPNQETLDRTDVYVIANKDVSVADLQNLRGVLQKFGFLGIRFFTHWDEKVRMTEIQFGREAVPYTTDPRELKELSEPADARK